MFHTEKNVFSRVSIKMHGLCNIHNTTRMEFSFSVCKIIIHSDPPRKDRV